MEEHLDELAAIEALNTGKTFTGTKAMDLKLSISTIRYYAGWADKIQGQVIETQENNFAYTRREPFGVVGQIIPTNFSRTWTPCVVSRARFFHIASNSLAV
jgi:aldehyde dehydrogenase (NAD+)